MSASAASPVMAAELLGLVYGFDSSFFSKHTIEKALGRNVPLDGY
eukprot:IDg22650t1